VPSWIKEGAGAGVRGTGVGRRKVLSDSLFVRGWVALSEVVVESACTGEALGAGEAGLLIGRKNEGFLRALIILYLYVLVFERVLKGYRS
jgi:hypothetical protein